MGIEELNAYAGASFDAYGEAAGMGSPIWKDINRG
jgi:hypothetical protein